MSSVDEQQEMEEQADATSTEDSSSDAPNNKRRDPSGVETRELKRPR